MKKLIISLMFIFFWVTSYAQFNVKSSATVYAENNAIIYTNENFINEGTVTLNQDSEFVVDKNFENNATFNYVNGSNKGIFVIGSGDATNSNGSQSLAFHDSNAEQPPYMVLNKAGGTATITRGLVELQETFVATSGTLDAASSISDTPAVNTVTGLVFVSNATNTAVIDESSNGVVNNVIIERYMPMSNRAFRAFSPSLNTNGTIKENLMEGGQVTSVGGTSDPRQGFGTHITGSATVSDGFDITNTNNSSMFQYTDPNGGAYTAIPNTSGTMTAGESYFLFVRGGRDIDLTNNASVGANPTKLRLLGDAHVGNFDASTVNTMPTQASKYAFVGNPYQAQVNLADVINSSSTTGIDKTQVYVYDPTIGTANGAWVTLNFNCSSPPCVFDSAVPVPNPAKDYQYLQPNQAFFVESNSATAPEVRFEEAFKKDTDPTETVDVFSDTPTSHFNVFFNLYESTTNNLRDGILIRFDDNYSDTFIQDEDAISFINFLETMASESEDGTLLAFDKRNINANGEIVQLTIDNYQDTNYSFTISVENNMDQDELFLIDNYLGTQTPLDSPAMVYNFTVDQNIPASFDVNRFQLGVNIDTLSNDNFEINGLSVYPNPVENTVSINLAEFDGLADSITLYDMTGKIVKTKDVRNSSNTLNLDMSEMSGGVYVITLHTDKGQFQQKLIKQ